MPACRSFVYEQPESRSASERPDEGGVVPANAGSLADASFGPGHGGGGRHSRVCDEEDGGTSRGDGMGMIEGLMIDGVHAACSAWSMWKDLLLGRPALRA